MSLDISSSKRAEALLKEHPRDLNPPDLQSYYPGWYRAPNRELYFGLGKVKEVGTSHDGGFYVRVAPSMKRSKPEHTFFDPFTDEDMPASQYPEDDEVLLKRAQEAYPGRPFQRTDWRYLSRHIGDVAYGPYISITDIPHEGYGRIVKRITQRIPSDDEDCIGYEVEPMRGGLTFHETDSKMEMAPEAMPRSAYSGSYVTQEYGTAHRRPRREPVDSKYVWYGGLPLMGTLKKPPRLGSENTGVYVAPDGQWFVGKGTVVALAVVHEVGYGDSLLVYVEPVPGKTKGDYLFFHSVTMEWMDELPENPIPGVACPRDQAKSLPPRWRNLPPIRHRPRIGEESPGRYLPPGAPLRDVYLGVGKVVKTGVTKGGKGRIYVNVEPIPGKMGSQYEFFDPWTGEDMPAEYYPDE
ncbi:hypothetical protein BDV18DRAFT_160453 [Aspergillus unguis]